MPATFSNRFGNYGLVPVLDHNMKAEELTVTLAPTQTLAKGTVMGQITAGGAFKAYASGSSDGSQIPKGLLAFDCVVDASGNVTIGGGDQGVTYPSAPIFTSGDFNCADCTGLDANAITAGNWTQLVGSISTGVVRLAG